MRSRGLAAEDLALAYLRGHGLELVARNYRSRFGELDLVLREGDTLVFVEVRLRTRADYGGAAASVTQSKQHKLVLAARQFLAEQGRQWPCRFDVVSCDALEADSIEWIKGAFGE